MGEIKNTQGATSGEVRALAEGDAAFASSSLRDGDPSRIQGKAGVTIFSKKLQEFWLAPGEGTTPLSREAHVYDMKDAKDILSGRLHRFELRSVDGAQAIEARQGGDAEGGSVEDKSAVAAGDVPASKSEDRASSSTPGEVERLRQIAAASTDKLRSLYYHSPRGSTTEVAALAGIEAITALLSHISTAGRGEGSGASAVMRKALEFYADPKNWIDTPSWDGDPGCITPLAIPIRDEGHGGTPCDCGDTARIALSVADATNPQDQE